MAGNHVRAFGPHCLNLRSKVGAEVLDARQRPAVAVEPGRLESEERLIDTPSRAELIAASHTRQEIATYLGVDSLEYLTLDQMVAATGQDADWCHACFSGDYPTPLTEDVVRHRLDTLPEPTLR
jgi:hypothetical protein